MKKKLAMEVGKKLQLKYLIGKVLKGLQFMAQSKAYISDDEESETETTVPEDVIEGHFAVIAMQGEETKRFIVELDYLSDPDFLRLLDKAGEEYGYRHKGAIAVPCRPQELQKIIENRHSATT